MLYNITILLRDPNIVRMVKMVVLKQKRFVFS